MSAALAGALYYMLNLSTVQNFYIQLEAFIVHFAALPWLFLVLVNVLEKTTRKNLLIFILVSFITTTQGFVSPLFFVYVMLLSFFLGFYFLTHLHWKTFVKVFALGLITIFINAYWFFPLLYYTKTNSTDYVSAYNNQQSTQGFIDKSRKYGTLDHVALLRGFYVESADISDTGKFFSIFGDMNTHLDDPAIKTVGYGMFIVVIAGVLLCIWNWKHYTHLSILAGWLFTFTFMAASTPPFAQISGLIQNIPALRQAFRVAFTKFSISLSFFYALCFGIACYYIFWLLTRAVKGQARSAVNYTAIGLITICILLFAFPVFQGNFLYSRTKITIPSGYFDLYSHLKTQDPHARIANMPQGWHYGWAVYKWGYSGSGFLWYGIEQPILDRSFDSWSHYNENYFWELEHMVYADKAAQFDALAEKYNIQYVLYDPNVLPYQQNRDILYMDKLIAHIRSSAKYSLEKSFPSKNNLADDIFLYKVHLKNPPKDTKQIISTAGLKNVQPAYAYANIDYAYEENGNYITDSSSKATLYYPFRSLFTGRNTDETTPTFDISEDSEKIIIQSKIPLQYANYEIASDSATFEVRSRFKPEIEHKNGILRVTLDTSTGSSDTAASTLVYDSRLDSGFLSKTASNCFGTTPGGQVFTLKPVNNKYLQFKSRNSENCYDIMLGDAAQNTGYFITVKHKYETGNRLKISLVNQTSRRTDLDTYLSPFEKNFGTDYVFIPPMQVDGVGYQLRLNNVSIYDSDTINDLERIAVYQIPYEFLSTLKLTPPKGSIQPGTGSNSIIVQDEAFNNGWYALYKGQKLQKHTIYNNWANAWYLPAKTALNDVVFVFAPQYLAYIGYGLLLMVFIVPFVLPLKKKDTEDTSTGIAAEPYEGKPEQKDELMREEVADRVLGKW